MVDPMVDPMVNPMFERCWLANNPFAGKPDSYYRAQLERRQMTDRELWAMFVNWGGALRKRELRKLETNIYAA